MTLHELRDMLLTNRLSNAEGGCESVRRLLLAPASDLLP